MMSQLFRRLADRAKTLPPPFFQIARFIFRVLRFCYRAVQSGFQSAQAPIRSIRNLCYGFAPTARRICGFQKLRRANRRIATGDLAGASRYFAKVFPKDLMPVDIAKVYADIEVKQGNPARAIEILSVAKRRFPGELSTWYQMAKIFLATGQEAKARHLTRDMISRYPRQIQFILDFAHLFREYGFHYDAVGLYKVLRVTSLIPDERSEQYEVCVYFAVGAEYSGYSREAEDWFAYYERAREKAARQHDVADRRWRPMSMATVSGSFGDFVSRVDALLKLRILEMMAPTETVLYLPPGQRFANKALVEIARKHLTVHVEPKKFKQQQAEQPWYIWRDYEKFALTDGRVVHNTIACALAEIEWQKQGRAPLFALPPDLTERGWNELKKLGLLRDDWFVTLHVRDAGFYMENVTGGASFSLHRNSDIATFEPAVRWIIAQGGWVIRMGDTRMKPMPFEHPRLIDYAYSPLRSDWMDVFLIGACRYQLATNSGPMCLAAAMGVVTGIANYVPFAMPALSPRNLYMPKMLRWHDRKRYLTFREMLEDPVRMANRYHLFKLFKDRIGIELVDNTADEILAFTRDLHRAACGEELPLDPREDELRELYDRAGTYYVARLAPSFLDKYSKLGCLEDRVDDELCERWEDIGSEWLRFTPDELTAAADNLSGRHAFQAPSLYRRALEIDPKHVAARHGLALCLRSRGELEQAVDLLRAIVNDAPESLSSARQFVATLLMAGRYDDATAAQRQLVRKNPASIDDWLEFGHRLCEAGHYSEALAAYSRPGDLAAAGVVSVKEKEGVLAAACEYAGDPVKARCWTAAYESWRDRAFESEKKLTGDRPIVVSLGRLTTHIGDAAARFDTLYKGNVLGLLHTNLNIENVVVDTSRRYVNAEYVELWRDHLPFASRGQEQLIRNSPWCAQRDLADIRMADGRTLYYPLAYSVIEEIWQRHGRGPVISLPQTTIDAGWCALSQFGMKPGDWFVALHVRESGFHRENQIGQNSDALHRSANIANYQKAIDYIIDNGGWVVRLGDQTMAELPFRRDRMIDYARSDIRSPNLDLFLMSQCRYLLGTNSGPMAVATSFGVPCGLTNYLPLAFPACSPRNLVWPKMLWHKKQDRHLRLDEMLTPPIIYANRAHIFRLLEEKLGIVLKENSADEILDFAQDLHGWANSSFRLVDPIHQKIKLAFTERGALYISPFSESFLKRYQNEEFLKKSADGEQLVDSWSSIRRDGELELAWAMRDALAPIDQNGVAFDRAFR